jgi:carboxymethylenebutenolidase
MIKIQHNWIQIPTASIVIDAYEAYPLQTETPSPAIVVLQEIFGVNSHIRSVVDRLAEAGYRAIAPALYQRTAPGFEVGYSEDEVALGRQHKDLTTAGQLLSDLQGTIAYLKSCPGVEVHRGVGCIGFCFGGHVAYLAATLPDIKATASFYGAGIPLFTPGGGEPTLSRTPEIQGTLYGFYGREDPLIPLEHVDQIEQALQAAQVSHRIFRYPDAGHGFCCDQRSDYRPAVYAQAWEAVMTLFQTLS